jgi:hypothetical protein
VEVDVVEVGEDVDVVELVPPPETVVEVVEDDVVLVGTVEVVDDDVVLVDDEVVVVGSVVVVEDEVVVGSVVVVGGTVVVVVDVGVVVVEVLVGVVVVVEVVVVAVSVGESGAGPVTARLWPSPASSRATPLSPFTSRAVVTLVIGGAAPNSPLPIWPFTFLPHARTMPFPLKARLCSPLAAIRTTSINNPLFGPSEALLGSLT